MNFKLLACAAAVSMAALATAANANDQPQWNSAGLLVAPNGMTLYTFDKDSTDKSACSGGCLAVWPAMVARDAATLKAPFTAIARDDGSKQVAFQGKPLYLYAADQKVGDATGDKSGGVWHVVRQGAKTGAAPSTGGYEPKTY
jgi:predicted lipoprotein with Yx(FWY)xxD motif